MYRSEGRRGHHEGVTMTSTESLNLNEATAPVIELGADLSPAVQAIETAYRAIQRKYVGTPAATIVVKRDQHAWGHTTVAKTWAPSKSEADSDASHFEIMISGENLRRGAEFVVATLLHESSHAFNLAAGVLDTDQNGRHNRKFADEAERRGLTVENVGWHGWTGTTLGEVRDAFVTRLIATVARGLAKAAAPAKMNLSHLGITGTEGAEAPAKGKGITMVGGTGTAVAPPKRGNRNLLVAVCGCGDRIRLSRGVLDRCAPTCQVCGEKFAA
jgi:hypothetical protein